MKSSKSLLTMTATVVLLTALACVRSATTTEQTSDSVNVGATDTLQIETSDSLLAQAINPARIFDISSDTEWDDSLKRYFTTVQIVTIKQAKAEFTQCKSASELAQFYLSTLDTVATIMNKQIEAITPTETSGDNSPSIHWNWFPRYFPVLTSDVTCSECSYEARIDLTPLSAKAATTPEIEDDLFFDVANSVYGGNYSPEGSIENSNGWYELVGCDFCSASTLGSGKRIEILRKLEKAIPARELFGAEMDRYLQTLLSVEDERYYFEKNKVLSELDQLIAGPVLNAGQVAALRMSRKKIGNAYFNCENADCKWPVY